MKYLLFVCFDSGLMHNCIYNTLNDVYESVRQLIEEENLEMENETMPTLHHLKTHLEKHDDYASTFTNGTWYHVQSYPVFGI